MKSFIRIGVDLAKNFFQIHGIEREGEAALSRKLTPTKFREFFRPVAPCRVGMEACGSAHYWGRELKAMGHGT
jgi:transposase